jgi:hypothetical protein
MEKLRAWSSAQFEERNVEPNSGLGQAISYLLKHWEKLTLFLRVAGAPIDNNLVERALKKAILHRKNSLFYKTRNGARMGDLFMSLIHTCELNGVNPFDYLIELQRHAGELKRTLRSGCPGTTAIPWHDSLPPRPRNMMSLPGRKGSTSAMRIGHLWNGRKPGLPARQKSDRVFGQRTEAGKMFRAGLYARVSTNDQQTIPLQIRALREYAARRGWTIAMQVKEIGSGAVRQLREKIAGGGAPPRDRCGAGVAVGSLGPVGNGSAGDASGTGASRRRIRLADRGAGSHHAGGRAMAGLLAVFAAFEREILRERVRAGWPTPAATANGWAGRQRRPCMLMKFASYIGLVPANPRSLAGSRSGAPRCGVS